MQKKKKLLELICKVSVYNINIHVYLYIYTLTENYREIKQSISFKTPSKRIKHAGINLPEETKDIYL